MARKSIRDEFSRLQRDMNNFFRDFAFSDWEEGLSNNLLPYGGADLLPANFRQPLTDIYETEKFVIDKMDLPGVDKKDIDISIKGSSIEVKVDRKNERELKDKKKGTYHYERKHSGFYRYITMPAYAKLEDLTAKYENGILELKAPKDDKMIRKAKKIQVR